jgi:hypothetical protein
MKDIDSLVDKCSGIINDLVEIQELQQNDARLTFFKHLHNIFDAAIISLVTVDKFLDDANLDKIHREYSLSPRLYNHDKERYFLT